MAPLLQYAALVVAGLVIYGLGRAVLSRLASAGGDAERADRAQADLRVAKKQGEIMAEHREEEDAISDLENDRF